MNFNVWMIFFKEVVMFGMIAKSFIDNVFRENVRPVRGSVVYCDLGVIVEHSGIYIGDNQIVHLDGSGEIEVVDPEEFLGRLDGLNPAMSIYVSCDGTTPVGKKSAAKRAEKMVGSSRDYSMPFDNCHQFTSGCLTGDFENTDNGLLVLKRTARKKINANDWRVWETVDGEYVE